ncbi:hypothetical protein [Shewanella baltica]|uniref:hypothetical protein n=1 Tax=Shewanella baltica TaxID=62322 RepID=UPI00325F145C
MKIKLLILLIGLTALVSEASQLVDYQGKVSVFAKSQNKLALHSHYRYYDKELKELKDVSYLELYDNNNVGFTLSYKENSPRFLTLTWTTNGKYLVGMSTRWQADSYLSVYSATGLPLRSFSMDCSLWLDESKEKELETKSQMFISMLGSFCDTTPELLYTLASNNSFKAIDLGKGVNAIGVCEKENCVVLPIDNAKEASFMTLYELRDKYQITEF